MVEIDVLKEMQDHLRKELVPKNQTQNKDSRCPYCHDTGYEYMDDGGQGTCKPCRKGCYQKLIMNSRISFANIPESFKDTRIDGFKADIYSTQNNRNKAVSALKAIKYWLHHFETMKQRGMGLYLYSNVKGSGKTRMAVSIANELIYDKQIRVKFATSLQILNEIKASWDRQGGDYSESKLLDFLSTTKVLIIDDFGVENSERDWIREKFYHIINTRYVDNKVTIFTSNSSLESLRYDERITNRIKERTYQIPFPDESVRDIIARDNMRELAEMIRRGDECG